jgi:enoyl-[acyl-carrier protein] reductase III
VTWLQFVLDFGHCRFDIVSDFGFRASNFRVSGKWVKYHPQNHDLILPKSEAELLRHGTRESEDNSLNDMFSLAGRSFLITGGTRGIGRAVSLRFARAGATVIANYVRDEKAARALIEEAQGEGLSITLCRADLTSEKGFERLKNCLENAGSSLSGFVHCAATGVHKPCLELTNRHFDWVFSLNVRAFLELIRLLVPMFSRGASVVALSSQGAQFAMPHYTLVGASKGALESLARHLALELAPAGIRVNILSPGSVVTDAWNAMPESEHRLAEARHRTPLGRLVSLDEIAQAAQFLSSDASSGMVGHTLVVDGGARIAG